MSTSTDRQMFTLRPPGGLARPARGAQGWLRPVYPVWLSPSPGSWHGGPPA